MQGALAVGEREQLMDGIKAGNNVVTATVSSSLRGDSGRNQLLERRVALKHLEVGVACDLL